MLSETAVCSENSTNFLPFELDYIPDDIQKKAKDELNEDEDTTINGLKLLRDMLKDEPNLVWQDDDLFLLAFLRARKFDIQRAFDLVKSFYNLRHKRRELYDNTYDQFKKSIVEFNIGYLPYRDNDGCIILVIISLKWKPRKNYFRDLTSALACVVVHGILSPATQISGFKVIMDLGGITLSHVPGISPTYLWTMAEVVKGAFPGRFKAFHVVNENHTFFYMWAVFKYLITDKIRSRFHFHGKNVKNLHKYFSPSILPANYEGELPLFDNTEYVKLMDEKADYLLNVRNFGYKK